MNRFAKWLTIILVPLILSTQFGCTIGQSQSRTPDNSADRDTLSRIVQSGELHISYVVFDPCVIKDPRTGKLSGSFVDALEYICNELKLRPVYRETTLKDFAAGLQSGQDDISIGPTFRTIGRSAAVAFTQPLAYIGNGALTRRPQSGRFRSLADLNRADVRIAVLQGQAMETYCRSNLPKAQLVVISGDQGLTAPLTAVSAGRADIGMTNSVTIFRYVSQQPGVIDLLANQPVEMVGLCWAVRPTDGRLLNFLNNSIDYLNETKRLHSFHAKYPTPLFEVSTKLQSTASDKP